MKFGFPDFSFTVPKHSPKELSIECNATFANVSWEHLGYFDWNGPPLRYDVSLNKSLVNGTFVMENYSVTTNISRRSFMNLHPYLDHWVSVSACTNKGCFEENTVHCRTLELGNFKFT